MCKENPCLCPAMSHEPVGCHSLLPPCLLCSWLRGGQALCGRWHKARGRDLFSHGTRVTSHKWCDKMHNMCVHSFLSHHDKNAVHACNLALVQQDAKMLVLTAFPQNGKIRLCMLTNLACPSCPMSVPPSTMAHLPILPLANTPPTAPTCFPSGSQISYAYLAHAPPPLQVVFISVDPTQCPAALRASSSSSFLNITVTYTPYDTCTSDKV